jgi:hypothetical protein
MFARILSNIEHSPRHPLWIQMSHSVHGVQKARVWGGGDRGRLATVEWRNKHCTCVPRLWSERGFQDLIRGPSYAQTREFGRTLTVRQPTNPTNHHPPPRCGDRQYYHGRPGNFKNKVTSLLKLTEGRMVPRVRCLRALCPRVKPILKEKPVQLTESRT